MAYGIGAIETNDGSVKSIDLVEELEAATDMEKTLYKGMTEFYVGQIVENKVNGKGNIEYINFSDASPPIQVRFENGNFTNFESDGRYYRYGPVADYDIKPVPKASEDKPMISNDIKPPKCFDDAIVHIDWAKETAEKIKLNQTYSRASAINLLETSDEIDIHQCLEEAILRSKSPPEQQPLYTGTRDRLIGRMLDADISPIPLAMKPVPEKTELTAKCALCGEPCKPRNGAKFYSICGGCK